MLKALFVLEIFRIFSWVFDCVQKQFNKNAQVNFKIYEVIDWIINNCNKHIAQHLKEVKATKQWNLVSQSSIFMSSSIFYLKQSFLIK